MGRTPRLLQGPDTDPPELGRLRTALARFRPVEGELLHVRKDGSPFWVRLRIMPVPDASGRYTHWVGVAREITARTRRATGGVSVLQQGRQALLQ